MIKPLPTFRRSILSALLVFGLAAGFAGCKRETAPPVGAAPETQAAQPAITGKVTVAVAASMRPAFEEVAVACAEKHPGLEIVPAFGASGTFFAQLSQKAPFDLFLSADTQYPAKLVSEGLAPAEAVFPYAVGRLVLWAPKTAGLDIANRGMEALTDARVAKISIANPEVAPYGRAAIAAFKHFGVEEATRDRLVRGENVGQAAQFTQSGAAQAGLFAWSLALAPPLQGTGDEWLVPAESHEPLAQSGAIIPWGANRTGAEAIRGFLTSPQGLEILRKHGFSPPEQP